MLYGIRQIFYISNAQKDFSIRNVKQPSPSSISEKSTITSMAPSKISIFFLYRKSLKNNIDKLNVALCLFGFGVFSTVKAFFLICPLVSLISKLANKLAKKCSE